MNRRLVLQKFCRSAQRIIDAEEVDHRDVRPTMNRRPGTFSAAIVKGKIHDSGEIPDVIQKALQRGHQRARAGPS